MRESLQVWFAHRTESNRRPMSQQISAPPALVAIPEVDGLAAGDVPCDGPASQPFRTEDILKITQPVPTDIEGGTCCLVANSSCGLCPGFRPQIEGSLESGAGKSVDGLPDGSISDPRTGDHFGSLAIP